MSGGDIESVLQDLCAKNNVKHEVVQSVIAAAKVQNEIFYENLHSYHLREVYK